MEPGQNSELQDKTQKPEDKTPEVKEPTLVQKEPSPEEEPKTLTITEARELVQTARMDAGRERKAVEVERDSFKSQSENLTSQIEDSAETIKKLEAQVDDLTNDDPKRFEAVKELREARTERQTLKADRRALEADKQANADRNKLAEDTLAEISIWELATKYDGGDPVKLKELCDLVRATTDEQRVKVADTLWAKKDKEPETPSLKPFSGRTSGGGIDFDALSPREKIEEGIRQKTK